MSDPRPPASSRTTGKVLLAVTAGLVTFLLVTTWTHERIRRESTAGRKEQLAELVALRQQRTTDLVRQLEDARNRLNAVTRASPHGRLAGIETELQRLSGPAGTRALSGSGIIVRLSDSALGKTGDPESADFAIQDVDLQLVVNALWASGAEAIAINGQRLVGTTAIRSAGGAVLVNYRVLTSPYHVTAIGDSGRLAREFSASSIARRFRSWVEVYSLGFSVSKERRLSIPAFVGSVRLRYAEPLTAKE